jgi:hypothetical protein
MNTLVFYKSIYDLFIYLHLRGHYPFCKRPGLGLFEALRRPFKRNSTGHRACYVQPESSSTVPWQMERLQLSGMYVRFLQSWSDLVLVPPFCARV